MNSPQKPTTHFGFSQVPIEEKTSKVAEVFGSVAPKYDLMNDVMSLGVHRLWKRFMLQQTGVRRGQQVLDLATGSGDLAIKLCHRVGPSGHVIASDINPAMLAEARKRLTNGGIVGNIEWVEANAEQLPFADDQFDCITLAFGLRNMTDKAAALHAMWRVLKPGGRCVILEFSKLQSAVLKPVYDAYSFSILPRLGQWIAGDADSYRYLAESIRMHPDQATLLQMMDTAGFENCNYNNLSGGIVAVHRGFKF